MRAVLLCSRTFRNTFHEMTTKPQTNAEADRLTDERMREMLLRQGRTEAEVDELLSNKEHKE